MPTHLDLSHPQDPPGWALDQAAKELYDVENRTVIVGRAWEIARDAQQLEDERHDEYDDPTRAGRADSGRGGRQRRGKPSASTFPRARGTKPGRVRSWPAPLTGSAIALEATDIAGPRWSTA